MSALKYILYARKSSEVDDKQTLSIDSQVHECQQYAREHDLTIVETITEAASAKAPGREGFAKFVHLLRMGQANALLAWKVDRLTRHPYEGGALILLLEEGKLLEIATPEKVFTDNGNDKFFLQLEFGLAKKYVDDLSVSVKRGQRERLARGWLPGRAPIGYLNDPATHTIVPDPDRFALVRKMWDLALAGRPLQEIQELAAESWGFTTPHRARVGGTPLSLSALYALLRNPFYYGVIRRGGTDYPGAHLSMVSKAEYDRVQDLVANRQHHRPHHHSFPFAGGLIQCGECGSAITAEDKVNRYGSRYTYCHCTRKQKGKACQQPSIRAEELDQEFTSLLRGLAVPAKLRDWSFRFLPQLAERSEITLEASRRAAKHEKTDMEHQLDELISIRVRGLIDEEEFTAKRAALLNGITQQAQVLARPAPEGALDERTSAFRLGPNLARRFVAGDPEVKREILAALGCRVYLKDRRVHAELPRPFREPSAMYDPAASPSASPRIREP